VSYVYKLDSNDKAARQIKTDAMRNMGQLSYSSIGRSFLISEARGLEGKEQIAKLVPPAPASIAADPATFVNYDRGRIDPRKTESVDKVIAVAFPDRTVALHVRRGIAEFVPESANYLCLNFPDPNQPVSLCKSDL
jgi:alkyl sulfatase BDS1-like metallo-beta-lactamase superfamily hydrolase